MTILYVTYPGDAATRFDRDYYLARHVPLVMRAWGPYGLQSCAAFWPAEDGAGTIATAECRFSDEAALSAETPEVMADIAHFTDAKPVQTRAAPV